MSTPQPIPVWDQQDLDHRDDAQLKRLRQLGEQANKPIFQEPPK